MTTSRPAALITGAAKRIGLANAKVAATNGYDIALHYNSSEGAAADAAASLSEQYNVVCEIFQADLSEPTEVKRLASDVTTRFPALCLLINSASVFEPSKMLTETDEFVADTLQVNLIAPWQLSRLCASHWKNHAPDNDNSGLIINYTDQRVTRAAQGHFAYNISKQALKAFTETAAVELAPQTRVNAIAPGLILPPPEMTDSDEIQKFMKQRAEPVPLKRAGSVEEIGAALDYFINNHYITGQTLYLDGGEHLL